MFPKNKPISQQTRCQTVSEPRFVMTQMQASIDCMRLGHVFFSNGNEMWKSQRHKTNHLGMVYTSHKNGDLVDRPRRIALTNPKWRPF
jgi:hypothetical protein